MLHAQALDGYVYEPTRIKPNTIYNYIKSNSDGSSPAKVSIYLPSYERVEVLKIEAHGHDAVFISARINWQTFSLDSLRSWRITPDGVRHPMAELQVDADTINLVINEQRESIPIQFTPWHIYNFDLISLNLMFRHRINPTASFNIGIYQPTWNDDGQRLEFFGIATLTWIEQRIFEGVLCDHYRISGAGIRHQTGDIWVDAIARHVQQINIPHPDHPDWQDFCLRLTAVSTTNPTQWLGLIAAMTARLA